MYNGFSGTSDDKNGSNNNNKSGSKNGGSKNNKSETNLRDFYRLPSLSKMDQIEIIGELTHGISMSMTPRMLVEKLNDFIISQEKAKKIVSQAIRNKYRMKQVDDKELRKAMRPSNILVSGKSGSGKTEIFR